MIIRNSECVCFFWLFYCGYLPRFWDGSFNREWMYAWGGEDVWAPGERWCHSQSSFLSGHYITVHKANTALEEMTRAPTRLECRCTSCTSRCRPAGIRTIRCLAVSNFGIESRSIGARRMFMRPLEKSNDELSTERLPPTSLTVRGIVDPGGVQSLTLAIVNKTGPVELGLLGALGIKPRNDIYVEPSWRASKRTDGSKICLVETVRYRILLKGLPLRSLRLSGYRNR